MRAQDPGDEYARGLELIRELEANRPAERVDVPVSELVVGLKCGGSDGFSGLTANPLVGRFSDWLVARGGSTVLTEVPEMFGAETLRPATRRAASPRLRTSRSAACRRAAAPAWRTCWTTAST